MSEVVVDLKVDLDKEGLVDIEIKGLEPAQLSLVFQSMIAESIGQALWLHMDKKLEGK